MDFILRKFLDLPIWARWLTVFVFFSSLGGLEQAWGKRRFVGEFSEATFAIMIYLASIGFSIWVGYKIGSRFSIKYENDYLGWVIGIVIFLLLGVLSGMIISEIPGVGWRYDEFLS